MSEQQEHRDWRPEHLPELMNQGTAIPAVAEALAVFQAASLRAPYIPPPTPQVRFSTGGNG
jgi:hypothetical protein